MEKNGQKIKIYEPKGTYSGIVTVRKFIVGVVGQYEFSVYRETYEEDNKSLYRINLMAKSIKQAGHEQKITEGEISRYDLEGLSKFILAFSEKKGFYESEIESLQFISSDISFLIKTYQKTENSFFVNINDDYFPIKLKASFPKFSELLLKSEEKIEELVQKHDDWWVLDKKKKEKEL